MWKLLGVEDHMIRSSCYGLIAALVIRSNLCEKICFKSRFILPKACCYKKAWMLHQDISTYWYPLHLVKLLLRS